MQEDRAAGVRDPVSLLLDFGYISMKRKVGRGTETVTEKQKQREEYGF